MRRELEEMVEVLLDDFYGESVDWRQILQGEPLALNAAVVGNNGEVSSVTFKSDGIRQVAPPRPFDATRCAWTLKGALEKVKDK